MWGAGIGDVLGAGIGDEWGAGIGDVLGAGVVDEWGAGIGDVWGGGGCCRCVGGRVL